MNYIDLFDIHMCVSSHQATVATTIDIAVNMGCTLNGDTRVASDYCT